MRRQRPSAGYRTCWDCAGVYKLGAGDTRYCPSCVTSHTGRCSDCRTLFALDGYHRKCPSCREQSALFDASVVLQVTPDQAAAVLGAGGDR